MPLYEEKLISPFAVRFTQAFVRSSFQDGQDLDATVAQIETRPGHGRYDVILKAPFPDIEVIRWSPKDRRGGPELPEWSREEGDKWFSFDNRRLCCLQRAAAAHWPKRVGVAVEVLYAKDMAAVWKKCTTTTCGRTVSYGTGCKDATTTWDWRAEAARRASGLEVALRAAAGAAVVKDEKASLEDLDDPPAEEQDQIMRLLEHALHTAEAKTETRERGCASGVGAAQQQRQQQQPAQQQGTADGRRRRGRKQQQQPQQQQQPPPKQKQCATPSTKDCSDASEADAASLRGSGAGTPPPEEAAAAGDEEALLKSVEQSIENIWTGKEGETYTVTANGPQAWTCTRKDAKGSKKFSLSFDGSTGRVWWGVAGTLYLEAAECVAKPDRMLWYAAQEGGRRRRRPRFVWRRETATAAAGE